MLGDGSPGQKRRNRKKMDGFFSKDSIAQRKKAKEQSMVYNGAESLSETQVREMIKKNKVKGLRKMEIANKRVVAGKKLVQELAKINEVLQIENKLDDTRSRAQRQKKDHVAVAVEKAMALRDHLEYEVSKAKNECIELDRKVMAKRGEWQRLLLQYNSEAVSVDNNITLGKQINSLKRRCELLQHKLDVCNDNNVQTLQKIAEHRQERVTALEIYTKQSLELLAIDQGMLKEVKKKKKKLLPEEIRTKRLRRHVKRIRSRVLASVKKFEKTRDALKAEIERETEMAKKMRRMSLAKSTKDNTRDTADRAEQMMKQRATMKKRTLMLAMRKASSHQLHEKLKSAMGAREMFTKIVDVKRRFGNSTDGSGNEALDVTDGPPTRQEIEEVIQDFVIRGQQLDSLMNQNNSLAKQVEKKTKLVLELEEKVHGNAKIRKKRDEIRQKKLHLENVKKAAQGYSELYSAGNEMVKNLKPSVHRLFVMLKCHNQIKGNIKNVYFEKDELDKVDLGLGSKVDDAIPNSDNVLGEESVESAGSSKTTEVKDDLGEEQPASKSSEADLRSVSSETSSEEGERRDSEVSVHQEDVFYYHNPMLALGVIEMQCQNLLLNVDPEDYVPEPQLDAKPSNASSPLRHVVRPTANEFLVPVHHHTSDEPPQYFRELQSETQSRNGMGIQEFETRARVHAYRSRGRRKAVANVNRYKKSPN
jgi:hypothetical protein